MKAPVLAFFALVIAVLIGIGVWQQSNGQKSGSGKSGTGHAALFDDRPYAEAKAAAASDGKIFVAKFTAEWCPPCKEMDRTTLVDSRVEGWVHQNAIAVPVNVDNNQELANQFRVEGIPTIVAMRGDKEIARVVGYRSPDQFLAWLKSLEAK